jgi:hypothetical protein
MLLIQTSQWWGPTRNRARDLPKITPEIKAVSYATSLMLSEALAALREYDDLFKQVYVHTAVEHTLIGVQTIDDLTAETIELARISTIEQRVAIMREELTVRQEYNSSATRLTFLDT